MDFKRFLPWPVEAWTDRRSRLLVILLIAVCKLLFWGSGFLAARWFPLDPHRYFLGFHHFQAEPRLMDKPVDFFSLWINGDAEWYLSIAAKGYPNQEAMAADRSATSPFHFWPWDSTARIFKYTEWESDRKYAFFPLFPLLIALFHLFLPLNLAAFVVTNLVSGLAFFLLHELVLLHTGERRTALVAVLLLMCYPFSVFHQAYFAEGLFLLLAVAAFYFLKQGRWPLAAVSGALLCLAKAPGFLIAVPLLVGLIRQQRGDGPRPSTRKSGKSPRTKKATSEAAITARRRRWSRLALTAIPLGLAPYAPVSYTHLTLPTTPYV